MYRKEVHTLKGLCSANFCEFCGMLKFAVSVFWLILLMTKVFFHDSHNDTISPHYAMVPYGHDIAYIINMIVWILAWNGINFSDPTTGYVTLVAIIGAVFLVLCL